jgi:alpha-methylacyl-CoA racemase
MGALDGLRVIEMAGLGPAPFCSMMLADMGAEVLRIDRMTAADLGVAFPPHLDLLNRNKRSAAMDLKHAEGLSSVLTLIGKADVLIEGFRPGVMEKVGLGPEVCLRGNPRLVYGRMTGWGQDGPLASAAGHDLNYIALSGALNSIGHKGQAPAIPLNLIGDFGGGALYLAVGILAALFEARKSGKGQVVDAAIVDGVASMMTLQYGFKQLGRWSEARGEGMINGGAPYYDVYETSDGLYVSIAAVEKRFYQELLERIGLAEENLPKQNNQSSWEQLRARLKEVFKTRTRKQWCDILEGTDACFAPVLDMDDCVTHPHNVARRIFVEVDGVLNPAPAPRFSRTPSELKYPPHAAGADTRQALVDWGFRNEQIDEMMKSGIIA